MFTAVNETYHRHPGSTEPRYSGRASIAFRVERSSAIDSFADRVIREMTY
jgi:hypothetical protein